MAQPVADADTAMAEPSAASAATSAPAAGAGAAPAPASASASSAGGAGGGAGSTDDIDLSAVPLPTLGRQLTWKGNPGETGDAHHDDVSSDASATAGTASPVADGDASKATAASVSSPAAVAAAAAVASPVAVPQAPVYKLLYGGVTDPGVPNKVNQDAFFLWSRGNGLDYAFGVLDGHGRELGKLAGEAARESFKAQLSADGCFDRILKSPQSEFTKLFEQCHKDVQAAFQKHYTSTGWQVSVSPEGYLRRRRHDSLPWLCIHGGTTATVCIVSQGRRLVMANVGDSSGMLVGVADDGGVQPVEAWKPLVATQPADRPLVVSPGTTAPSNVTLMSFDHSPECASEFKRMAAARPCPHREHHPELLFVYDTLSASKLSCPPIFSVSGDGEPKATNRGAYYKNVRNEWATLVAVPPYAKYQDALAFTRSVGDFHLQTYGVSHVPSVCWVDLPTKPAAGGSSTASGGAGAGGGAGASAGASAAAAASSTAAAATASSGGGATTAATATATASKGEVLPFAMVICSDGVWDNWKFEDVAKFVMAPSRLKKVVSTEGARSVTMEFMIANLDRARINFGNQADNMTAVLIYFLPQ